MSLKKARDRVKNRKKQIQNTDHDNDNDYRATEEWICLLLESKTIGWEELKKESLNYASITKYLTDYTKEYELSRAIAKLVGIGRLKLLDDDNHSIELQTPKYQASVKDKLIFEPRENRELALDDAAFHIGAKSWPDFMRLNNNKIPDDIKIVEVYS